MKVTIHWSIEDEDEDDPLMITMKMMRLIDEIIDDWLIDDDWSLTIDWRWSLTMIIDNDHWLMIHWWRYIDRLMMKMKMMLIEDVDWFTNRLMKIDWWWSLMIDWRCSLTINHHWRLIDWWCSLMDDDSLMLIIDDSLTIHWLIDWWCSFIDDTLMMFMFIPIYIITIYNDILMMLINDDWWFIDVPYQYHLHFYIHNNYL